MAGEFGFAYSIATTARNAGHEICCEKVMLMLYICILTFSWQYPDGVFSVCFLSTLFIYSLLIVNNCKSWL